MTCTIYPALKSPIPMDGRRLAHDEVLTLANYGYQAHTDFIVRRRFEDNDWKGVIDARGVILTEAGKIDLGTMNVYVDFLN